MSFNIALGLVAAALVAGTPVIASAQPRPESARLIVTVVDPSAAVIPNATVTISGQDGDTAKTTIAPVATSASGVATFDALPVGRYVVRAEFPGFETVVVRDVRLRNGDTRRSITLPIKKVAEDVTVARDRQSSALDPRGNAFSTVLTREQIAALPDDPDEMEQMLKAMAPPGASIRVDGFSGGKLPPKSQIRSIRLPRLDMFAAQNHGGLQGMIFIDIMTQPGNGPLRGSADLTLRDDVLNARNPFTPVKGDESLKQGGGSLGGTIVPNKSSFSINFQKARLFDTGNLLAALPGSTIAQAVRRPTDRLNVNGRFDQALNKDHMLRFSFQRSAATLDNLGVGSFDLLERAYATENADNIFRVSENGAVGRRFFSESRFQLRWSDAESRSVNESPTIRVLDAFTSGGAQQSGGRHVVDFEAATDLDYVRGAHSWRTGILLEGGQVPIGRVLELPGDVHVRESRRLRGGQAADVHAAGGRSGHPLLQSSDRSLPSGRLSLREEPDAELRPPLRSADADFGSTQFLAAAEPDLLAVEERKDDVSWRRRVFLGLARHEHLRTDVAGRRFQAAGAQHPQPVISGSGS